MDKGESVYIVNDDGAIEVFSCPREAIVRAGTLANQMPEPSDIDGMVELLLVGIDQSIHSGYLTTVKIKEEVVQ